MGGLGGARATGWRGREGEPAGIAELARPGEAGEKSKKNKKNKIIKKKTENIAESIVFVRFQASEASKNQVFLRKYKEFQDFGPKNQKLNCRNHTKIKVSAIFFWIFWSKVLKFFVFP